MNVRTHGRRAAAFTILELLIAMAITLVLLGIVSDVLNNVHKTISIGAANAEVITYAASLEQRMRDDFRRLNTQGFIAVNFGLNYGTTGAVPGPNTATATPVIPSPYPSGVGSISQITLTTNGAGYLQPPPVTFIDPAGTGSGAVATAILANDNSGRVSALNLISGGSGYSANTQVVFANPVDQICFFANGPWVTTRYNVQTTNSSSGGTTDSGLGRTFQTDVARIWYGHLAANELQVGCLGADLNISDPHFAPSFSVQGDYAGVFQLGTVFSVVGTANNNGSYTVSAPSVYNPIASTLGPANTTIIYVSSVTAATAAGYLQVIPSNLVANVDESGNPLQPQYWRLGRHALLISDEPAVRYDGYSFNVTTTNNATVVPEFTNPIFTPSSIIGFAITNPGAGYASAPALLAPFPIAATFTVSGGSIALPIIGLNGGNNLMPLYASQSIWQASDNITTNTPTEARYYGVENGLSDIAAPTDLTTIRQTILSTTPPSYLLPPNNSVDSAFSNPVPSQRMSDACFRVYGTPYINPGSLSAELTMPAQSVLVATCSAFRIDVSYDGVTFIRPMAATPTGTQASLTANISGGAVTSVTVVTGGTYYCNPNSIALVVNPTTNTNGTGAVMIPVVNPATGAITSVNVVSGGSGYTNGTPAVNIVTDCCAGYGLNSSSGCMPWPKLIRITATLQDQKSTIHNLATIQPQNIQAIDGRPFTYVLEVPQP